MYRNIKLRQDLREIAFLISPGSRVLDLGCGDGALLAMLRDEKKVIGSGIEFSQEKIIESVAKGVPVVQGDLNSGLSQFKDNSFDYVVLSKTLQAVQRPDLLLKEMARVGRKVILSVINMGFYELRLQLLFKGRMPESKTLPYNWYDTPNIHLGTIKDFHMLCFRLDLSITNEIPMNENRNKISKLFPNLLATTCVFEVEKG